MPITADFHLHSSHSGDSDTPMEEMILQGISQGLTTMCFTEHNDFDYPVSEEASSETPQNPFLLRTDPYLYDLAILKGKYADKIKILFGVELGLQPEIAEKNSTYANSFEFDFIIGSSHVCHGKDPYYPAFFEGRSEQQAYREYFESILENLKTFSDFDVYGHLDYVVRYGPSMDQNYSYAQYQDIFDEILKLLLKKGKGIELNTGGIKSGMKDFHPCMEVLKRYRELGGEMITIGSDSHDAKHIAAHFDKAAEVLKECGFQYYTVFERRIPTFKSL